MSIHTPEQWFEFCKDIHSIVVNEIDNISDLPISYPKLIVMYEFFRLIRGEAFYSIRPSDMGESQKEIYKMEDEIAQKLKDLESKLDPKDSKTKYHLDQMSKLFSLKYFNY